MHGTSSTSTTVLPQGISGRDRTGHDLIAVMLWSVAIALFFLPVLSGSRVFFYFDITELNYPYRAYFGQQIQSGQFSLWCPHLYSGFPLFAESQTGHLYPLKFLFYSWMPAWLAFGYDTVFSIWLSGLTMYAYLRQRFSSPASLIGAIPFGFGGFMAAHLIHTSYINSMPWIPLSFLFLERAWRGERCRNTVFASIMLTMQIFAGNMQIAILTFLALTLVSGYWILVAVVQKNKAAIHTILLHTPLAFLIAFSLGAVQILPAKQLLDHSPRQSGLSFDELTNQNSWHPELLPTLFLPHAFGSRSHNTDWMDGYYWYHEMYTYLGVSVLLIAFYGITQWRQSWIFGHLVLTVFSLLFMMGRYLLLYDVFEYLPILSAMRAPVRESVWLGLTIGSLAAAGVQFLIDRPTSVSRWPFRAFLLLASAAMISLAVTYHPLIWGEPVAVDSARLSTSIQTQIDPLPQRHQRLIGQIGGDLITAALLVTATGFMLRHIQSRKSLIQRRRWALLLSVLIIGDIFWAARHLSPTLPHRYWSKEPKLVSLLTDRKPRPRIHPIDYGLHSFPGYETGHDPLNSAWKQTWNMIRPVTTSIRTLRETAIDVLPGSAPAAWSIDSSKGHTPIYLERMHRYLDIASTPYDPFRMDPWQFSFASISHLVTPPGQTLQRTGTSSRVWKPVRWPDRLQNDQNRYPPEVYHNDKVQPRIRLTNRVLYAQNASAAEQLLRSGSFDQETVTVIEDSRRPLPEFTSRNSKSEFPDIANTPSLGETTLVSYAPEYIQIKADVKQPSYLILTDAFYPEWGVRINDQSQPVVPAQLAFRAVYLEPGLHNIEFYYQRNAFYLGLLISSSGLLLGIVLCLIPVRRQQLQPLDGTALHRAERFASLSLSALFMVLILSVFTHWDKWRIQTDDAGQWIGSFHSYHWEQHYNSPP